MCWIAIAVACLAVRSGAALAWGDEGHEVVGLIAQHYLTPAARQQVDALLAGDPDPLTPPNIADATTWADKYRDADRDGARKRTAQWHFVDIDLAAPDLDRACFGHPALPAGTPASDGPGQDWPSGSWR
jgi:hypothetical protein